MNYIKDVQSTPTTCVLDELEKHFLYFMFDVTLLPYGPLQERRRKFQRMNLQNRRYISTLPYWMTKNARVWGGGGGGFVGK